MTKLKSADIVMRGLDVSDAVPVEIRSGHVVVGNFDGVHIGHRALLRRASELSEQDGRPVVALTFEHERDNSSIALNPQYRLTDRQEKVRLLLECGADAVVTHVSDGEDTHFAPSSFVESILVRGFGAKSLVVGQNFRLGHRQNAVVPSIAEIAPRAGIAVEVMPSSAINNGTEQVTSSAVRSSIERGDIRTANAFLGRRWTVDGVVVHGDKRGRQLGFPTANMALNFDVGLKFGIYAVRLLLNGRVIDGVACYGKRPQFDDGAPRLEVHLLDFCDDIYGQQVCIEFVDFQRAEMAFHSVDALIQQMTADCQDARRRLRDANQIASVVSVLDRRATAPVLH